MLFLVFHVSFVLMTAALKLNLFRSFEQNLMISFSAWFNIDPKTSCSLLCVCSIGSQKHKPFLLFGIWIPHFQCCLRRGAFLSHRSHCKRVNATRKKKSKNGWREGRMNMTAGEGGW